MGIKKKLNQATEAMETLATTVATQTVETRSLMDRIAEVAVAKGIQGATAVKVEFEDGTEKVFASADAPELNQQYSDNQIKSIVPQSTAKAGC